MSSKYIATFSPFLRSYLSFSPTILGNCDIGKKYLYFNLYIINIYETINHSCQI